MNVLIKKRQLILATLIVALGAAVFVNWYYTSNKNNVKQAEEITSAEEVQNLGEAKYVNADGETADYFSEIKLNRQKARDESLDKLNESLEKAKSGSDEAKNITDSIDELTEEIKRESDIESLVGAKLNGECVAVINGDTAQIVVTSGALNDDTALQITDIVTANTDIKAENIKISEAK